MKLSEKTLEILKNFSTINAHLFIEKDANTIRTMSESKHIFAEVTVDEVFPANIGIMNLHKLLQTISVFDDPDIVFEESFLTISDLKTRTKFKYLYTDPSCLRYPKSGAREFPTPCSFVLSKDTIGRLLQASRVTSLPDVKINYDSNVVTLEVLDRATKSSNVFSLEVTGEGQSPVTAFMKIENLKLIPDEYQMFVSEKAARLKNLSPEWKSLQYFIGMEIANVR